MHKQEDRAGKHVEPGVVQRDFLSPEAVLDCLRTLCPNQCSSCFTCAHHFRVSITWGESGGIVGATPSLARSEFNKKRWWINDGEVLWVTCSTSQQQASLTPPVKAPEPAKEKVRGRELEPVS